MEGDDQARFCHTCRKNVYNLSDMTQTEAQALINRMEGKLCVRFYTRADGTLLTQDCPVGLRAVRRKIMQKLSYAAALLLSCATGFGRGAGAVPAPKKAVRHHTMGKIAVPKPKAPKIHPKAPVIMGRMMALPPPTMGAPVAPKQQRYRTVKGIRRVRTGGGGANSGSSSAGRTGRGAGGRVTI